MNNIKINDIVKGIVTGIEPYGIFVIVDDYTGLIHISEIANKFVSNIANYVSIGEKIYCKVLDIDNDNKKLKLSIKGLNYKEFYKNRKVKESVRGFTPLEENLSIWTEEAMKELEH